MLILLLQNNTSEPSQELTPPTGAGKTHTMLGMDSEPGIYLQTLTDLFQAIEETRDHMDYSVSMSYLEVNLPICLHCLVCKMCVITRDTSVCVRHQPCIIPCAGSLCKASGPVSPATQAWWCGSPYKGLFSPNLLCSNLSVPLQIYNEVIQDLLNPSSGFLDLREDSRGSIQSASITEISP